MTAAVYIIINCFPASCLWHSPMQPECVLVVGVGSERMFRDEGGGAGLDTDSSCLKLCKRLGNFGEVKKNKLGPLIIECQF